MNLLVAAATSADPTQVQIALITAGGAIMVAILGIIGAQRFAHPKLIPTHDPDSDRNKTESILASYTGDQNEFISLVIKDSKDLHERVDKFESIVEQLRKERMQFVSAVARYINKLVRAWGSGGKMPVPDDEDLHILEETLPADWRHRSK